MTRTAYFYANWRVSTEKKNKWGGIIKWFSAWTHSLHDLQKEHGLWTTIYVFGLLRCWVNLNILRHSRVHKSARFRYKGDCRLFKICVGFEVFTAVV
jgi:hypothetical protein